MGEDSVNRTSLDGELPWTSWVKGPVSMLFSSMTLKYNWNEAQVYDLVES